MAPRSKTTSFITELPLKVNPSQEAVLLRRLEMGRKIYNACLGETLRRLRKMRASAEYQAAWKMPPGKARSQKRQARNKAFRAVRNRFGFGEYALHSYAKRFSHSYLGEHIDTSTVQKLATRVWGAVNEYDLGKRGQPRFKGKNQFDSLEGKSNKSGILWREERVKWFKLELAPLINPTDLVIQHGLQAPIKFLRLLRRKVRGRNRFYVQLVNEGRPYRKANHKIGKAVVGLDLGPSTIAAVGDEEALLKQFCEELERNHRKIKRLQRQIERQRRASNPDNYHEDKWVRSPTGKHWLKKKGKPRKGCRHWLKSRRQRANEEQLAELHRQEADHRKSLHGQLVNNLLSWGKSFKTEKLSYKAWQKIFGRSVGFRAPGMFMAMLRRKAESAGGTVLEFPTRQTKLSQTCICETVKKKGLSKRWHDCSCGVLMQRDLFSAFLAQSVEGELLNAEKARELWSGLESVLVAALRQVISDSPKPVTGKAVWPASFGLKEAQRLNGSPEKLVGIPAKSLSSRVRLLLETAG